MKGRRKTGWVVTATLLGTGLVLFATSYGAYHFSGSYPWEYLIEKEVRLQRVEMRIRVRLRRLAGSSRDVVLTKMGRPTETALSALPRGPFWGPQTKLVSILKPGQAFEEWQYRQGLFTYLIWFADTGDGTSDPKAWKVVATGTHREGRVY